MTAPIANLRKEYTKAALDTHTVEKDPINQFRKWFVEAQKSGISEPNAMVLSTTDIQNQPFQRTVLMKALDKRGIVFYTNYKSRKAVHIAANNQVSLLFPWYVLERQVAINGTAERVSIKESLKYFSSRPHGSQLGAWVSQQSTVIGSRSILEMKLAEMKRKFRAGKVPLPDFWGGYLVKPFRIEFWQGRQNRLHDRILYEKKYDGCWEISRLSP